MHVRACDYYFALSQHFVLKTFTNIFNSIFLEPSVLLLVCCYKQMASHGFLKLCVAPGNERLIKTVCHFILILYIAIKLSAQLKYFENKSSE